MDNDATQLLSLGYAPELPRRMSFFSMLGMAFTVLNSWSVLSAALPLALRSGGPVAVLWGLPAAGICDFCLASSLAQFISAYPTAGGQYHWVAVAAPPNLARELAYATGWLTVFGWISVCASGSLLTSQVALGLINAHCDNCAVSRTSQLIAYNLATVAAFLSNCLLHSMITFLNKAAFIWSIAGFAIIPIITLACGPDLADARYVFGHFINETGWPDTMALILGMLQAGLILSGFDAVAHMVEELPDPSIQGPKIMMLCVALGTITGFAFLVALMFVSGGEDAIEKIIRSNDNPLAQIMVAATQSTMLSTCLAIFPLVCLLLGTISIFTTTSRMVFAFARDNGLPFSRTLALVHKPCAMPFNALCFSTAITILLSGIFLISDAVFNAIASASVAALSLSYALPVLLDCLRGRLVSGSAPFQLFPPVMGGAMNLVGVLYAIITSVLFLFPPSWPISGSNMNYGAVVLFTVFLASAATWLLNSRDNYKGPVFLGYHSVSLHEDSAERDQDSQVDD